MHASKFFCVCGCVCVHHFCHMLVRCLNWKEDLAGAKKNVKKRKCSMYLHINSTCAMSGIDWSKVIKRFLELKCTASISAAQLWSAMPPPTPPLQISAVCPLCLHREESRTSLPSLWLSSRASFTPWRPPWPANIALSDQ